MLKDFLMSILISTIVLAVINIVGQFFDFYIPLNIWTVLVVGMFRIPGFIFILLLMLI